jgi:mono/diheme cytochrome c family protein
MCLLLLVLAACGSKSSGPPSASPPTPSPFPTFEFVQPTPVGFAATDVAVANVSATQAFDPDLVAAGKNRYDALDCGSCHGADAKGTSKGKALIPTQLTQAQFIDFLRTGGKLGNAHLYSTNRLSDTGSKNLYLYIQSLSAGQ